MLAVTENRAWRRRVDRQVGRRLRWLREERGWDLEALSRRVLVPSEQLAHAEAGAARLPASVVWQLCCVFNVPLTEIFEGI